MHKVVFVIFLSVQIEIFPVMFQSIQYEVSVVSPVCFTLTEQG